MANIEKGFEFTEKPVLTQSRLGLGHFSTAALTDLCRIRKPFSQALNTGFYSYSGPRLSNSCPDHLIGLDTKLSSVVEPRLASLDVTLTGLEERVTKMEERADVINEVGRGLYFW